jgi:hypothetical protein
MMEVAVSAVAAAALDMHAMDRRPALDLHLPGTFHRRATVAALLPAPDRGPAARSAAAEAAEAALLAAPARTARSECTSVHGNGTAAQLTGRVRVGRGVRTASRAIASRRRAGPAPTTAGRRPERTPTATNITAASAAASLRGTSIVYRRKDSAAAAAAAGGEGTRGTGPRAAIPVSVLCREVLCTPAPRLQRTISVCFLVGGSHLWVCLPVRRRGCVLFWDLRNED